MLWGDIAAPSQSHPGTLVPLGAGRASVLGGNQWQKQESIQSKYDKQAQEPPGESVRYDHAAHQQRYKPQRHNHGYVLPELLPEAIGPLPGPEFRADAPVSARAAPRAVEAAIRAQEYDDPERAGEAVGEVRSCGCPRP